MESKKVCRSLIWVTFCTCITLCVSSPTRRLFVSVPETTSSDPGVTNEDVAWDDSDDDFDSEGDGWLKEFSAQNLEYDDYEDAEESNNSDSEFLSPTDTRLVLEDDDQSSLIKVRHTSKNSYAEPLEGDNSVDTPAKKEDSDEQFVFTIDEDDEDDDDLTNSASQVSKDDDDFVLEDSEPKEKVNVLPHRETRVEDDEDEDDDLLNDDEDMFDSPEENAQVIYGDHVFLY